MNKKKPQEMNNWFDKFMGNIKGRIVPAAVFILLLAIAKYGDISDGVKKLYFDIILMSAQNHISLSPCIIVVENAIDSKFNCYNEMRDLATNTVIGKRLVVAYKPGGPCYIPGESGSNAEVQMKIRIRNDSGVRLTNVVMQLNPMSAPFDFKKMVSTPNLSAELSRPLSPLGGDAPYIVKINEFQIDEAAVLTFNCPITRENVGSFFSSPPPKAEILVAHCDQFMKLKLNLDRIPTGALIAEEITRWGGGRGFSFRTGKHGQQQNKSDFSYLPEAIKTGTVSR